MKALLALGALAALLALPAAAATVSTADQVEAVEMILHAFDPIAPVDTRALDLLPVLYLDDRADVWHESNGLEGLQTEAGVDAEGNPVPADTYVAGLSMATLPPL